MKTRNRFAPTFAACLTFGIALLPAPARADEGMWMPQQIPQLAERLKAMGFRGDPKAFADLTGQPMGAIVSLGGCSASFVSPDGLIVTNHHCVQGALQFNSTPQKNLLVDGFLASSRDQELTAGPGSRVYVTTSVKEVTAEITGKLDPKLADRQRHEVVERRLKERTAACEKDGLRCRVASFFDGLKYFELAQMEIQDVRLVYAPAEGIGNFGGETDNWQWPRHTGDWSFYRAYVSPTGKSVAYAKENIPFKPKHWLKISPEGAGSGDLVFVAGYPGRTQRFATYAQTKELAEWSFPRTVRRNAELIALLEDAGSKSKETAIRVATRKRGLNNTLTNRKGVVEGFKRGNLLAKKEVLEKDILAWIAADPVRKKAYGDVLPALDAVQSEKERTRERDAAVYDLLGNGSVLLPAAHTLYELSRERPKKDLDREPEYQERNWSRIREGQERLQRSYDPDADRSLLRYVLVEASKLTPGQRIEALDREAGLSAGMSDADAAKKIDALLDRLYKGTKLGDKATRLALVDKPTAEILATKDPMIALAVALDPLWQEIRERAKTRDGAYERLGARYAQALLEKSGGLTAPDANSTLRVTYGRVLGVPGRDGLIYLPQTTLQGVVEKASGTGEFNAPKKQLDAIAAMKAGKKTPYADAKLGSVPVNFLSSVDTTGGNSGSATLNAKGELCGLLFDGTFDTVASDYLYDTEKTRSIHVDSRYMLWTMTEVDGAGNLLKEIGEAPSLDVMSAPTH
ncbi:MAG: S46 family peptidase [Acidobacteriota bacterium]